MADYVEYDSAGTLGEEYNERVEKNSDESEDRPKVLVKKRKGKQEERGKREEKWKLSEIEKFLELYELYRCLWDYKEDEYKDRNAKEHAWEEIVRGMEKREFTVKSVSSGKCVISNKQSISWSNQALKFSKMMQTKMKKLSLKMFKISLLHLFHLLLLVVLYVRSPRASKQIPYAKPISRKVAGERLGKIQNAVQQLKDISDKVLAPERKKDMCEYELFGQFIASQLKKLPEINALAVMQKIQTCLMNERMTVARGNSMSHYQWEDTLTTSSSMVSPNQEDSIELGAKDILSEVLSML
ncbi:hypothetical protein J6590_020442 [Homalodisca vitripennis]|nr:hypothetical protein J6590_020442 [Homalodisca vitripennis]